MKKQKFIFLSVLASSLVLSGCVARTYPLTRDRIDQDLSAGNRGYLTGSAPAETAPRKTDRTVQIFEIEIGPAYKTKCTQNTSIVSNEPAPSDFNAAAIAEPAVTATSYQQYTVGKNDTLQKISKKFYGTTKKWMKIYEANKDVLKGPDRLYPGQTLNIPELEGARALSEPAENLK